MVKRTKIKKTTKKRKPNKKGKRIKRIGVFVPIQADIELRKKELDAYIIDQGCQRLIPIYSEIDLKKGVIELYTRVRYIGKRKAKKVGPITSKSLGEELSQLAKKMSHEATMENVNRLTGGRTFK